MVELLQTGAPPLVTAILGGFTVFAFLFWAVRRHETAFGWLAATGALWFCYNVWVINGGSGWIPLLLIPVTLGGFIVSFARVAKGLRSTARLRMAGRFLWHGLPGESRAQGLAILVALALSVFCLVHDVARWTGWPNLGFELMPYAGLAVFATLAFLLAQRVLDALSVVENLNMVLESKARAANASLAASEAARRALEVSGAVTHERDRLMREIHDGIGSSLVTAIAASERQGKAVDGPSMLKRALTDLRIAVDSLEPVGGDIATLMASLRYRVEPDIKKAGIEFDWQVEEVPEFDWLDAVNALHVLRTFQEAFSNIVGHAEATKITVRCHAEMRHERAGVLIEVADNGIGFVDDGGPRGHGLRNMTSRAEALDGELEHVSRPGLGTSVSLWLPVSKQDE
jgi:signal transduction histidine kinase